MKLIAYIRVSTDQQAESGLGLEAQITQCEAYAKKNGMEVAQIFSDEGYSGTLELGKRPALLAAIESLEKGDILLVAKRDRLGRDTIGNAMIERSVERKGARIVSASGDVSDSNDPASILMKRMIDAFAEYECLIIGARTKAALQVKKTKNQRVGHIPFGHRLAEDGVHLEKDPREQGVLQQMTELRSAGMSIRGIAAALNERKAFNRGEAKWHHASVHRVLESMKAAA